MPVKLKSSEVQQSFGEAVDRALLEGDVIVERYGTPRVAIVEYKRYQRLVEAEQELLRTRLQQASAATSARAAHLSEEEVDELIERARTGCGHSESRHLASTRAGASVHTGSQRRQVCRVRPGRRRELPHHRGQGPARPPRGGGCAYRNPIRLSSCYSPMILTNPRFCRRALVTATTAASLGGPSPVAAMAFTSFCPTKNAPLVDGQSDAQDLDDLDTNRRRYIHTMTFRAEFT